MHWPLRVICSDCINSLGRDGLWPGIQQRLLSTQVKQSVIRKMQIKTSRRYYCIPTNIPLLHFRKLYELTITSVAKGGKDPELSYIADRNAKWCSHVENSLSISDKGKYILTLRPINSTPQHLLK